MSSLEYFKGKLCTILTSPTNRFFDETQHTNTFVGLIEKIDQFGIWVIQLARKKKSYFTLHSLVAIIEEAVTVFDDEEAEQVREQLESRIPPQKNPQQLVSIEDLKNIKKNSEKKK